ncbi:MAG: hypothetical protein O3C40_02785 [Planctomycetota bacterium]|nr:hypothetical protein [Planctomycetota bacterium]
MRLQLLALALFATMTAAPACAGDSDHDGKHDGHGNVARRTFCPHCGEACYPTVTKGKETKHCWNVETKAICIPKVRFPWESDCGKGNGKDACPAPNCGRTKYVNVLMKHEYECSTCKYSWDVDSYKNGNGKSDKDPADESPALADPPPVEASLPQSNRRIAPIAFEEHNAASPAKKSYTEILTSFFK